MAKFFVAIPTKVYEMTPAGTLGDLILDSVDTWTVEAETAAEASRKFGDVLDSMVFTHAAGVK